MLAGLIGLLLLAALIAVLAVAFGTGLITISPPRKRGLWSARARPIGESCRLLVTPDLICPRDDCVLQVEFDTITESAEATGTLSVRTPAGNEIVLAKRLSGRIGLPGDDATFADGPGLYTFKFVAEGLRERTITLRDDATLMAASGHGLYYPSAVTYSANSQVYERQVARDTVILGEGEVGKGHRHFAFCDKLTSLAKLRYGFGGTGDRQIGVTVFNIATGQRIAAADLSPGDAVEISPAIPMSDGAAIEMSMSAYSDGPDAESNAFPIGSTVQWTVELGLDCS